MILRKYGILLTTARALQFDLVAPDGVDLITTATFATGDVKISKDGGAEANTTNLPTDEGSGYRLILTATELTASRVKVIIIDQTGTKIWLDIMISVETYGNASAMHAFDLDTANVTLAAATHTGAVIPTVTTLTNLPSITSNWLTAAGIAAGALNGKGDWNIGKTGYSLAATGLDAIVSTATGMIEIAKAIWDRVLTGATHNITNSAGKRLRQVGAAFTVHSGTAQAGTANTITLDAGADANDDIYAGTRCIIVAGTGIEEHGIIISYVGATKVATMAENWVVTPDATSEFELTPASVNIDTWAHKIATASPNGFPDVNVNEVGDTTQTAGDLAAISNGIQTDLDNGTDGLGAIKGDTAAILLDTNELQSDDVPTLIASVQSDTDNIQTRLPAALVGGRIDANSSAIDGNNTAAINLKFSALGIVPGACEGTPTTTVIQTDLAKTTDDTYNGRVIIFTSGNAAGEATDIISYVGVSGTVTVTALATAPAAGDTFVIV